MSDPVPTVAIIASGPGLIGKPDAGSGSVSILSPEQSRTLIDCPSAGDLAAKADLVGGKVPSSQLPSYVDDVIEAANLAAFPATGETGKIYVAVDTGNTYRWSGSAYVELTSATAVWGSISGTLSNQTDLQSAINARYTKPVAGIPFADAASDFFTTWLASLPTTEPFTAGLPWLNNRVLQLSAGTPPTITGHPSSTTVLPGVNANFTVSASGATSYEWQRNTGTGWAAITGATSATLTVVAPDFQSQGYQYRVVVTGAGGSTTTNAATLTIRGLRFQVRGFTDSNFFQATTDSGAASLGTVRVIFKLLELPTSGQKVIISRVGAGGSGIGGWYVATGWDGSAGAANVIAFAHRNAASINPTFSPVFTFSAGDVGKHFVLHATATNSAVRLYLGGMEVGGGSTPAGNLIAAPSTARVTVGRYQHATGLSCPHLAVVHFETTATVLTAQQILADAGTIQDYTTDLNVPALPSSIERFDADSLESSTNWAAITGGFTLTRNGTLTVEQF